MSAIAHATWAWLPDLQRGGLVTDRDAIPLDALEGHTLVVGTTGSGKSYLVRGQIERLRAAGRRVGAIDKLGNLWGLTVSTDGKGPGFEFVIFGGRRLGTVPMRPEDGARIGRLFVERNLPAIFDVSAWHRDDQDIWVEGFCDAVFETNSTALHLVLDEAQSWVPQGGGRNAATGSNAFGAVRRIAEQGRGYGIHLLMAVQRLSRIDKTTASMAQTIVAMRQTGAADRRAVRDLVSGQADGVGDLYEELPRLPTGSGYVWNPVAGTLARVAFPPNATFDSSRTPRHGDAPVAPIAVSSALVDELRVLLEPPAPPPADGARGSEPVDPPHELLAERDRRIAELEALVAELRKSSADAGKIVDGIETSREFYASRYFAIVDLIERTRADDRRDFLLTGAASAVSPPPSDPPRKTADAVRAVEAVGTDPADSRELRALAGLIAVHPGGLSEAAWAARTGYSRKGGTWIRRRKRYVDDGLIVQRDGRWFATADGIVAAGGHIVDMPPAGPALVAFWAARLDRAAGRALKLLADVYPKALTREAIAVELGMSARGGAFVRALAALKTAELAIEQGKRLRVAASLLPGADA